MVHGNEEVTENINPRQ